VHINRSIELKTPKILGAVLTKLLHLKDENLKDKNRSNGIAGLT